MSDPNGVARALVVLLLGGLVALFAALATDMAVPTPQDPWAAMATNQIPAAKQAEFDQRRTEIQATLDKKQITQAQADEQMAAVEAEESALYDYTEPDPALVEAFDKVSEGRGRVMGGISAVLVAFMLAAGVVLVRRGIPLGEVPLFAGGFLGVYGVGVSGLGSGMDPVGIGIAGLIAAAALAAGLLAFTPPAETPAA
jgi:hypothetical protein